MCLRISGRRSPQTPRRGVHSGGATGGGVSRAARIPVPTHFLVPTPGYGGYGGYTGGTPPSLKRTSDPEPTTVLQPICGRLAFGWAAVWHFLPNPPNYFFPLSMRGGGGLGPPESRYPPTRRTHPGRCTHHPPSTMYPSAKAVRSAAPDFLLFVTIYKAARSAAPEKSADSEKLFDSRKIV